MAEEMIVAPDATEISDKSRSLVVSDASSEAEAAAILVRCDIALRDIEEKRKEKVRPLNEVVNALNSTAKKASAPFLEVKEIIVKKMGDWRLSDDVRRIEEKRNYLSVQSLAAGERGEIDKAEEMAAEARALAKIVPKTVEVEGGSIRYRTDIVIDSVDVGKLNDRYVVRSANEKLIKSDIKDGLNVPGVIWHVEKKAITYET